MRKIYFLFLVLTPSFAHAQYYGNPLGLVREWQDGMIYGMQSLMRPGYGPQYYGGGYQVNAQQPAPCGYTVVELPREKVSTRTEVLKALGSAGVGALLGYATTGSGQGAARGAAGGGALYGSIELAKRYLRPGQMVVPVPCPQQQQSQQVFQQPSQPIFREVTRDIPTEMTFVNETPYLVSVFINSSKKLDLLPDGRQTILLTKLLGTRIQGVAARPRENDLVLIFDRYNLKPQKEGSVITFTMPST
mgnify:CR=1 FL=1